MSKIALTPNGSGSGVFTIASPNSNTNRTITLPDESITLGAGTPSIDDNGNATAMTIDSDENVLIGTTDINPFDNTTGSGIALRSSGAIYNAINNGTPLALNRMGSDGTIAQFRQGGSTTGQINTRSGQLSIGVSDTGLEFNEANDNVLPVSLTANGGRDAAIDLGSTGARFKNIYTSGGIYLGGTVSANALDDYEEGTWTPTQGNFSTWSSPTFSARYTKIGRLVRVQVEQTGGTISWGGYMGGLPFNPSTVGNKGIGNASNGGLSNLGTIFAYAQNQIWAMTGASNQTNVIFGISYFTDD